VKIRDWLDENSPNWKMGGIATDCAHRCALEVGTSFKSVRDFVTRNRRKEGPVSRSKPKQKKDKPSGFSREEFRARFDDATSIRLAIETALKELAVDEIVPDSQFRQERCHRSSPSGWRDVADADEFSNNQFRCDGKIWWATEDTVWWALDNIGKVKSL